MRRVLVLALGVVMSGFSAASARAADDQPVEPETPGVLLIDAGADPVGVRVAAELRASGIRVTEVQDAVEDRTEFEIGLLTRATKVAATIDLNPEAGECRVWVVGATGARELRAVVRMDGDPAVVALRVTEVVRAARAAVQPGKEEPGDSRPPATPGAEIHRTLGNDDRVVNGRLREREERFAGSIASGAAFGPGGFGPSAQGFACLSWTSAARWGLEFEGIFPISAAHWSGQGGSADLAFGLVSSAVRWAPWSWPSGSFDLAAGVGAVVAHTEGHADPGYVAATRTTWAAAPLLRLGYSVVVTPFLRFRLDVATAATVPRITFTEGAPPNRPWAEPLFMGTLGVELVIPHRR